MSSPIGRNCRARLAVGTFTLVPVADGAAICFICSEPEFRPLGMVRMCVGFDGANEYSGYTLRSEIEAPLITREVLPETYFLLVIMAADAQAGPFLEFQASC